MKIDIFNPSFQRCSAFGAPSIVGEGVKRDFSINYHNFRENAEKARHVDDESYGGGQGMLLRAQ